MDSSLAGCCKSCGEGGDGLAIKAPMLLGKEHYESAYLGFSNASNTVSYKSHGDR